MNSTCSWTPGTFSDPFPNCQFPSTLTPASAVARPEQQRSALVIIACATQLGTFRQGVGACLHNLCSLRKRREFREWGGKLEGGKLYNSMLVHDRSDSGEAIPTRIAHSNESETGRERGTCLQFFCLCCSFPFRWNFPDALRQLGNCLMLASTAAAAARWDDCSKRKVSYTAAELCVFVVFGRNWRARWLMLLLGKIWIQLKVVLHTAVHMCACLHAPDVHSFPSAWKRFSFDSPRLTQLFPRHIVTQECQRKINTLINSVCAQTVPFRQRYHHHHHSQRTTWTLDK